ncbi:hypothetical protein ACQPZP_09175 [Spirillospora sp. CA-142024]
MNTTTPGESADPGKAVVFYVPNIIETAAEAIAEALGVDVT